MPRLRPLFVVFALSSTGFSQATPPEAGKPALSLALPDAAVAEQPAVPGPTVTAPQATAGNNRQALPDLFDDKGSSSAVEFDGKVSTRDDAPITAPEVDGVEVQMKSRF